METQSIVDLDMEGQKTMEKALGNHLVVEKICSYLSGKDLLNFRSVNHLFHDKATRRMRLFRKPVALVNNLAMQTFLDLMQTRLDREQLRSVPFTAYQLNLKQLCNEILERFASEIGQHVRILEFGPEWYYTGGGDPLEHKLVLLLSRTVNLAEIELVTDSPVQFPKSCLDFLPKTYPNLGYIQLDYKRFKPRIHSLMNPSNSVSLLNTLIDRAPNLSKLGSVSTVRIPDTPPTPEMHNPGLSALRSLSQQSPVVPVSVVTIKARPHTLPVLQQLQNLDLQIDHLDASLHLQNPKSVPQPGVREVRDLLGNFCAWLATLSPHLQTLFLDLHEFKDEVQSRLIVPIPALEQITEFILKIDTPELSETEIYVPLAPNQFHRLSEFYLIGSRNTIFTVQESPQPSVELFNIYWPGNLESNAWHRILPNLTTIQFNQCWTTEALAKQNLSYVLQFFPNLTHLDLDLRAVWNGLQHSNTLNYWDILTGGASRPESRHALFEAFMDAEVTGPLEKPADGVYHTPSLGNLQGLKTLQCRPGSLSNLDAIVFMTRIGQLGQLNEITILAVVEDFDLEGEDKTLYRDLLDHGHKNVFMTDYLEWRINVSPNFPFYATDRYGSVDEDEEDDDSDEDDDESDEEDDDVTDEEDNAVDDPYDY